MRSLVRVVLRADVQKGANDPRLLGLWPSTQAISANGSMWAVLSLAIALIVAVDSHAAETAEDVAFFEAKIRPVLISECYSCHSAEAKSVKGGLRLDTKEGLLTGGDSGPAVVPGDVTESLLLSALRYEDYEMPPSGQLPDRVISDFEKWVRRGASDPRSDPAGPRLRREIDIAAGRQYWAFQPVRSPTPPAVSDARWPLDDIDRFVMDRLDEAGLRPVRDADSAAWLRRITFDLIGLPPTDGELQEFVADPSKEARQRVVDRLLASPHFGEHWGRHWLDVARFAESTGRTRNYPFQFAWRYRNYVIEAFNSDTPYDEFIVEQLAGDLLPHNSDEEFRRHRIATGFLALGSPDLNERDRKVFQMDMVADQIDTMSRSMLGLTVGCARCHDHKFDPIPTADYYALAGIFKSTELLNGYSNRVGGGNAAARAELLVSLEEGSTEQVKPRAAKKQPLTDVDELIASLPKNLAAKLRGLKQQLDQAVTRVETLKENTTLQPKARQRQLAAANKQRAAKKKQLRNLSARLVKQRVSPITGPMCLGVRDSQQIADCRVHVRGEVTRLADSVPRGFLQVLGKCGEPLPDQQSGRLELARWIASADNPLTARVMVNRVWHHLFGQGLVRTVDNFGEMGAAPTHPRLLDYLADEFVIGGWSVKQLIRRIVLSRTYGLSHDHNPANYAADANNDLMWRTRPRRLNFEAIRDAMLMVSGQLDRYPPESSPVENMRAGEIGTRGLGNNLLDYGTHRSVYLPVLRSHFPDAMTYFDFPDSTEVCGARDVTTVPTQSLFLLNSPFVIDIATKTAALLLQEPHVSDVEVAKAAQRRLFSREAVDSDVTPLVEYVQQTQSQLLEALPAAQRENQDQVQSARRQAWAELLHAMLASAEFRYR